MQKRSNRIVWSPENGGCLMEQRMVNGAWVDWNSMEEGQYPALDARTKKVVKWHNYRLKKEALDARVKEAQLKVYLLLSEVADVQRDLEDLGKEINKIKA